MIQNLVYNLCESFVVNIDGVTGIGKKTPPTPITYLTQWKIVGNSEVHGVGNLTSWKVSGNSIVQDGVIMSCGDLGQDGKYHVKISNGATIFDIPLTEPLRKVNDIADTIEFPSNTEGKALVTRNIQSKKWNTLTLSYQTFNNYDRLYTNVLSEILLPTSMDERTKICLSADFVQNIAPTLANVQVNPTDKCMCVFSNGQIYIRDTSVSNASDFVTKYGEKEFLYILATPTTELVDAPQIAVSPTNTYASANVVPYSAFEHTENKEIWSCGEYSAVDGKYHILVQPLGGNVADIALTEPLRKVNSVADSIEFPSDTEGKALVTRNLAIAWWKDMNIIYQLINNEKVSNYERFLTMSLSNVIGNTSGPNNNICLSANYEQNYAPISLTRVKDFCMCVYDKFVFIRDIDCHSKADFEAKNANNYFFYVLATPTTELVDAPQIEEAESYSCVISQGVKTVEWSSFETE